MNRVGVYVDGFNLYYALKGFKKPLTPPIKWLDIGSLARSLAPKGDILFIKYFTALLSPYENDPGKPQRQQVYLSALKTIPNLQIILGSFSTHPANLPLQEDPKRIVRVLKTVEKGSDVNLASHLLLDAFDGSYDEAVIISADSDLATPIRMTKEHFDLRVRVFDPRAPRYSSCELKSAASDYLRVWFSTYKSCRFPNPVIDLSGKKIHSPWS